MILVESGSSDIRAFEAKIQFAGQLMQAGHLAVVDASSIPDGIHREIKYESIRFLADAKETDFSRMIVIGAEVISDQTLTNIRSLRLDRDVQVDAIGRYTTVQSRIGAQSKLAYVLGYEPTMHDLSKLQPAPILQTSVMPLFAPPVTVAKRTSETLELFLIFSQDFSEDSSLLPYLAALGQQPGLNCSVIAAGAARNQIRSSPFPSIAKFGFSELSPDTIANLADICVYFGPSIPGERMAAVALSLLSNSGLVIDCTKKGSLVASGAPIVRGPVDIRGLTAFLHGTVLANREPMGAEASAHPWMGANSFERLTEKLELKPKKNKKNPIKRKPRTIFIPTNGVGLGHAQRCSLVAGEMKKPASVAFAAFPSCIPLLQNRGFDCLPLVSKSQHHDQPFANDLLNFRRLGQVVQPGDTMVFDGGYVFDSVYRSILETQVNSVWIRRGLWQPGQSSQVPLEREHVFDRVIAPDEAFAELNTAYSYGDHVHRVGPIVQTKVLEPAEKSAIRQKLQTQFGQKFKNLIITMLGGGEAADRSAQMLALCAQFNGRPDCLHLMVVWPNAKIAPALFGWPNSHVVKTQNALELCQASDLAVSAVGYNSFNEILFHEIPAIFIPQIASYMDDQERRAHAAADRDLAVALMPSEMLMLSREVAEFLDNGKSSILRKNLAAFDFPDLGTKAAAALIEKGSRND